MMTRRQAIQTTAIATAAVAMGSSLTRVQAQAAAGPFTLPPLPYAFDALEPHIDAQTMQIHHDKHHAAYVTNVNKALGEWPDYRLRKYSGMTEQTLRALDSIPERIRTVVRNNLGGHYNHSLFWQMMKKDGGGEPKTELARAIEKYFGNFTGFKSKFTETATKVFGSGWAWLVIMPDKSLEITARPNQDSPITGTLEEARIERPRIQILLGIDVWEHAYYLKYQNKRADYIAAWFNVINWDFVSERFEKLA